MWHASLPYPPRPTHPGFNVLFLFWPFLNVVDQRAYVLIASYALTKVFAVLSTEWENLKRHNNETDRFGLNNFYFPNMVYTI